MVLVCHVRVKRSDLSKGPLDVGVDPTGQVVKVVHTWSELEGFPSLEPNNGNTEVVNCDSTSDIS